ncbi:MAG TPA: shikimate kinase [Planctomycetaceae bacterium]|nr:shikimate kinase [Planctomycetaceae bacterium]
MIVTLIGYRGTGKTSVAPRLAERLGLPWNDADPELERRAGRSIREIFATDGEPEFRRLEREVLVDLLSQGPRVLAVGGGAVLNPDTRRDFRAAGPVVWLQADAETLAARIAADATSRERRPNLTATGGLDEIRTLLAAREPLYRDTATLTISTTGKSIDDIVNEILAGLPGRPA